MIADEMHYETTPPNRQRDWGCFLWLHKQVQVNCVLSGLLDLACRHPAPVGLSKPEPLQHICYHAPFLTKCTRCAEFAGFDCCTTRTVDRVKTHPSLLQNATSMIPSASEIGGSMPTWNELRGRIAFAIEDASKRIYGVELYNNNTHILLFFTTCSKHRCNFQVKYVTLAQGHC